MENNLCIICGEVSVQFSNSACLECVRLVDTSVEALLKARHDGVPIYGPSLWNNISPQEHLIHAIEHMGSATIQVERLGGDDDEDHLSHAICRLIMVKALIDG